MRILVPLLFSLLFIHSHQALAQRPEGGPGGGRGNFDPTQMAQREKEAVLKRIEGLTDDQKMLIEGIYNEFGQTLGETVAEARKSGDFSQARQKIPALRKEKDLLIKDVLNETQFTMYMKLQEKMAERRKKRRQERQNPSDSTKAPAGG